MACFQLGRNGGSPAADWPEAGERFDENQPHRSVSCGDAAALPLANRLWRRCVGPMPRALPHDERFTLGVGGVFPLAAPCYSPEWAGGLLAVLGKLAGAGTGWTRDF